MTVHVKKLFTSVLTTFEKNKRTGFDLHDFKQA